MKQTQQTPVLKSTVHTGRFLLSLVIPCYNESPRVDIMLHGLAEFNEKWQGDYEVIIVDDGSKDDTVSKVEAALNAKYADLKDKVRIEKMTVNGGKGSALKRGVALAQGDYILTLDADMSTRPVELINWQRREKQLFSGNDSETIYIGSRKHEEGKVEALQSRRLIGGVFNGIVQVVTSLQLKDTQCGFKLYPGEAGRFLFGNMRSTGWQHDVELLYQANLNDIHIKEMPINWVNQPESKVNVISDSFKMFWGVIFIALRIWFTNSFVLPFSMPVNATPERKKQIVYRSVFNVLGVLLMIVMPMMSFQFGVTGDEHWHFDYGNSVYNYFFRGDNSILEATSGIQYYGGIFDFLTSFAYNVFHLWDHYTTMHFINAIVGAIGIIYAGKLAKLFGGWNAGILAMVLLICSPSWFGHNFANPKDIPFSVGYTAGIYFILLFLKALPQPNSKHVFGLVCSIGWAMGVRIGGFLLIAYLVLFIALYAFFTSQLKTAFTAKLFRQMAVVSVLGYLIAILFWPYAHLGIISKPLEALKVMSNFFVNIGMLYDGKKILSNQIPWYYIPKYIMYTAPLVVLAGSALGLVSIPLLYRKNKTLLLFSLFVLFTVIFPVAYAVHKKSSLYDGWRHFLFIYPPLVVIATIGWMSLVNSRQKALKFAALGLVVAGLIMPMRFAVANHPFEALYYNEIAGGLKGIYGKYETDYYMMGITPATEWLIKNEHLENKQVFVGTNCTFPMLGYMYKSHFGSLPAKEDKVFERMADYRMDSLYTTAAMTDPVLKANLPIAIDYVRYYERYNKNWEYCIVFSRFVDASQLTSGNWPPAETIHTIDVDGVPMAAILKRKTMKDYEGFMLMKAKKYDEAKSKFLEAVQLYPANDLVWEALCQIYDAEGKTDSAIYAGRNALKTYPGDINVYQVVGNAYLKDHKADSAIAMYKELGKYNPGYSHFFLGYTYATTGNANNALQEIDAALDADMYMEQAYKLGMQIAQQTHNSVKMDEYSERARIAFPETEEK
jgi:glycosyltransferase involved in cell wall biosynthesis/tetratricopeptide (TPR) repeat protein